MPRHREKPLPLEQREECRVCKAVPKDMVRHLLMTHSYTAEQISDYERGMTYHA